MKTLIVTSLIVLAALAAPALATGKMSLVDHPDVPNCTIIGPNADNCENFNPNASIVDTLFTEGEDYPDN